MNEKTVRYLLVGGHAVAHYGHVRSTADMDVWVARDEENARKLVEVLREFGFDVPELTPQLLQEPNKVLRMGMPPIRIELLTEISGVSFAECYPAREIALIDGIEVPFIGREHLRRNKRASGRPKDLEDLEHLS